MCNVANKLILAASVAVLALVGACKGTNANPAQELYQQALDIQQTDPQGALALLDSIDRAYAGAVEIRREAMALRPALTERVTVAKLQMADSLAVALQARYDSIAALMVKVDNPQLVEPYLVAREGRNPNLLATDGIEGRVSNDGEFFIISSLNPSSLRHNSITLIAGGDEVSTPEVPYDGELNYRINSSEMVTYLSEQSVPLGEFALDHSGEPITVKFNGERSAKTLRLTPAQASGLATAYRYAKVYSEFRSASIERERLNRILTLSRDQRARLGSD